MLASVVLMSRCFDAICVYAVVSLFLSVDTIRVQIFEEKTTSSMTMQCISMIITFYTSIEFDVKMFLNLKMTIER